MGEKIFAMPRVPKKENTSAEHKDSLRHFEANRDVFEHYARGKVNVKPAPEGVDTFAFDLETDDIYLNARFYKQKGLSDEKTTYATLHEIEHFLEKKQLLAEKNGERAYATYLSRLEKSKAYGVMDNCIADIRENTTVIRKTDEGYVAIERGMYKEDLFPSTDLSREPKHLQLPQAILREARVPGERCAVSPEVRMAIDELKSIRAKDGTTLLQIMGDPNTPMSVRLKLQDKYVWPKVAAFLKQDEEEQKKNQGKGKGEKPDDGTKKRKPGAPSESEAGRADQPQKPEGRPSKGADPNETFKDAYARADKRVPNAVPVGKEKATFKKWQETHGDPMDRADREYAEKLGVKKEDLQRYRSIADQMRKTVNPETNQSVIDDLRGLISRIIAKRKKEMPAPRYPVEEGEDLVDPTELVTRAKVGDFEPKAWETHDIRTQRGKRFGTVEITLVCDRSTSMAGRKQQEQQKAAVLFMEALKEFADFAKEESSMLEKPLEVRSEVYSFQSSSEDAVPLKHLSDDISEKERIDVAVKIGTCSGSTTDFVPLETIAKSIDQDKERLIADGELKKIIIVFTDGESDDPVRVKNVLGVMREKGVVVIGIGITKDGKPALTTYAPEARLAETAEQLPQVLSDVLREHLSDI
ncbi:MAG: VWA domain-containing protein [Patescibacteria group bacterium]